MERFKLGVLDKGFKPEKCKTDLKMVIARIKILRNAKIMQVGQMRREVAKFLDGNQDEKARILVEYVLREEKILQAYDLMDVYCKVLVERMSVINSQKTCPTDLKEAVSSLIFASMRCSEITELVNVQKNFTRKYGKAFYASAIEVQNESGVSPLVIEKLSVGAPDVQTKIKTLSSIANENNVKWEPKDLEEKSQKQNEDLSFGPPTSKSSLSSMPILRGEDTDWRGERNCSASGSNWNTEFKDASSAIIAARADGRLATSKPSQPADFGENEGCTKPSLLPHVHPNLPKDYDSFLAYFRSLQANQHGNRAH